MIERRSVAEVVWWHKHTALAARTRYATAPNRANAATDLRSLRSLSVRAALFPKHLHY